MSEPALDWDTCKHNKLFADTALRIVERHVDDNEAVEAIQDDIHSHVSDMTMIRGARRMGYR